MAHIPFHPKALRYRQKRLERVEAYQLDDGTWYVLGEHGAAILTDPAFNELYELDDTGLASHMNMVTRDR